MKTYLRTFLTSEEGAVTIDWVVLTALVIALATAAFGGVEGGVANATAAIVAFLESVIAET